MKIQSPPYQARITANGETHRPEEDGLLNITETKKIRLDVQIKPADIDRIVVFTVSKDQAPVVQKMAGNYHIDVPVHHEGPGKMKILYPENNLRLLYVDGRKLFIDKLILLVQHGKFFFVRQTQQHNLAFVDRQLTCTDLNWNSSNPDWKGFDSFLNQLTNERPRLIKTASIPTISFGTMLHNRPRLAKMKTDQAQVAWYDESRNVGVLNLWDGRSARVHFSQLEERSGSRRRFLMTGETVLVKNVINSSSAGNSIPLEAKEVKINSCKH